MKLFPSKERLFLSLRRGGAGHTGQYRSKKTAIHSQKPRKPVLPHLQRRPALGTVLRDRGCRRLLTGHKRFGIEIRLIFTGLSGGLHGR